MESGREGRGEGTDILKKEEEWKVACQI